MDIVFEYAAPTHPYRICTCICLTIHLYLWETRTVHLPHIVFASHSGVCHISRWKNGWNKLFGYLRSNLYLVFGWRNLIIWGVICICDKLNLSAHWALLSLYLHLSPSLSSIKMWNSFKCALCLTMYPNCTNAERLCVKGENCVLSKKGNMTWFNFNCCLFKIKENIKRKNSLKS